MNHQRSNPREPATPLSRPSYLFQLAMIELVNHQALEAQESIHMNANEWTR